MGLKRQRDLAVVVAAVSIVLLVSAVLLFSVRIRNVGRIKAVGIEVFGDAGCSVVLRSVDWGLLAPGDLAGTTVYVKNVKNSAVNLTFAVENWDPAGAGAYLFFDVNYTEGFVLQPGDVLAVLFSLFVDPGIEGVNQFSFDIVVTAREVPLS